MIERISVEKRVRILHELLWQKDEIPIAYFRLYDREMDPDERFYLEFVVSSAYMDPLVPHGGTWSSKHVTDTMERNTSEYPICSDP